MTKPLASRLALVTGASRGIGYATALALANAGAHIVAVAAAHRSKLAPDIQTFDEGGVKGFTAQSYIGIVAPAKTPPDVVAKLQNAIAKGLQPGSPAAERLISLGSEVATPEQMTSSTCTSTS